MIKVPASLSSLEYVHSIDDAKQMIRRQTYIHVPDIVLLLFVSPSCWLQLLFSMDRNGLCETVNSQPKPWLGSIYSFVCISSMSYAAAVPASSVEHVTCAIAVSLSKRSTYCAFRKNDTHPCTCFNCCSGRSCVGDSHEALPLLCPMAREDQDLGAVPALRS